MKIAAAALSALVLVSGAPVAFAGPVADAAARAEALQAEGKSVEALAALDEAVDSLWKAAPLSFRKAMLVEGSGEAGAPQERPAGAFQTDEEMRVYVEPVGYGYGGSGVTGKTGFDIDLTIQNGTGQVISEGKDAFSISKDTRIGYRGFGMTLSFKVPYVRPGDYVARFTVRDQNSSKTGSVDVPFTVAAPGVKPATP